MSDRSDKNDQAWVNLCNKTMSAKNPKNSAKLLDKILCLLEKNQGQLARPKTRAGLDTFDIYVGQFDRDAQWIETVQGLEQSTARIREIASATPGQYFLYRRGCKSVIETIGPKKVAGTNSRTTGVA